MEIFSDTTFRDLERLGFTINESKVYLMLIKLGPSFAGRIAKEAQLDRSSTYNALKSLIQRGIISTVFENKRTIYVPEDPKKIIDYFKEKQEVAKNIIPTLKQQFEFKKPKSTVKMFRGFKGVKSIFQNIIDTCDEKSTYYVMGSEGYFSQNMPYYLPVFRKRKEEKKIKSKLLVREGRKKKTRSKFSEYKTIPSDVASPATINIYEGKVAIFIWDDPPQAILIENNKVSKTFENYFKFMWKNAKKMK